MLTPCPISSVTSSPVPSCASIAAMPPAALGGDDQVVRAAGVAGGLEPELARRIARENVAREHAVARPTRGPRVATPSSVERRAGHRLGNVRPLRDREPGREYLLSRRIQQERRLPVLAAAADGRREVADQAAREFRDEQHRRAARGELAGPQACDGAPRRSRARWPPRRPSSRQSRELLYQ